MRSNARNLSRTQCEMKQFHDRERWELDGTGSKWGRVTNCTIISSTSIPTAPLPSATMNKITDAVVTGIMSVLFPILVTKVVKMATITCRLVE
jgi:hypothetical protein